MGKRRSISEQTKASHEAGDPKTWEAEPARESVVQFDEDTELDQVFSDFPQNESCIEIFRTNAQGGRPVFLEEIAPAQFSMAYVTSAYGGGKFIAKGKYKDGSRVRMPFEIEGDPIPLRRKVPQGGPVVIPAANGNPATVAPELAALARDGGSGEMVAILGTLMKTMVQEMKGSEVQMLEKLRLYKELFAPGAAAPATPIEQALSMFKQGIELGSAANGNGEGGFPWMLALDKMKDPITKLIETVQTAMIASRAPANVTPRTPAAPTAPGVPIAEVPAQPSPYSDPGTIQPNPGDPMLAMVKMVMPALVNGATNNANPDVYVDFLLDQVPRSAYDSLRSFLMTDDCLDKIATVEPGIRFQKDWWVSLRSGLLEALNEELGHAVRSLHTSESADPTTGAPPDSDNLS